MKNEKIKVGGFHSVVPKNVVFFEADVNYSHVYLKNGMRFTVATTLKSLEARFKPFDFYRSHKKFLINVHEVESCGNYEVQLINQQMALVSRRKLNGLLERIKSKAS
ncbi:LytTR family DNA-binding domain-containing protein [uncultured Arcticibacterium sp.]|uniref:LytR/AlgR family response regulator transcription factor n=1 Tax=uncultured Arcticibacterium sp. TaxID=2173042 RepID=UPI0030F51554